LRGGEAGVWVHEVQLKRLEAAHSRNPLEDFDDRGFAALLITVGALIAAHETGGVMPEITDAAPAEQKMMLPEFNEVSSRQLTPSFWARLEALTRLDLTH
jgi:hypothetical protein